jgi:hypothetical protein
MPRNRNVHEKRIESDHLSITPRFFCISDLRHEDAARSNGVPFWNQLRRTKQRSRQSSVVDLEKTCIMLILFYTVDTELIE